MKVQFSEWFMNYRFRATMAYVWEKAPENRTSAYSAGELNRMMALAVPDLVECFYVDISLFLRCVDFAYPDKNQVLQPLNRKLADKLAAQFTDSERASLDKGDLVAYVELSVGEVVLYQDFC